MIFLLGSSLCSIVALFSVRLLRKWLHPLEMVTYWLFITANVELLFTIFGFNLGFVKQSNDMTLHWSSKETTIIIVPIIIMWYLAILHLKWLYPSVKICLFGIFPLLLTGRDYIFWKNDYLIIVNWTFLRSYFLYAGLIMLVMAFRKFTQYLMRRELVRV